MIMKLLTIFYQLFISENEKNDRMFLKISSYATRASIKFSY